MVCVIATLGFDVDFILRRLSRSPQVSKLVCVGLKLKSDERSWVRVEQAFKLIDFYCRTSQLNCRLEPVSSEATAREVRSIIERELREECETVELYLTGGPRIAIVSTLLASLTLPDDLVDRVTAVVEGEAFEARIEIPTGTLRRILHLSDLDRRILVEASKSPVKPSELSRTLGVHKPAVYRRSEALAAMGLLKKTSSTEREYVSSETVLKLFKLVEVL
ncbi:MAG: hypothetical protein RMI56_02595 [Sulfolobales archaeon]|nr:hypothetical protein [Sulfolobales archaeon]